MKLRLAEVLCFYEEPLVVIASDPIGGRYIGVGIKGESRFLMVGAKPIELVRFKAGMSDLRELIISSTTHSDWMTATLDGEDFDDVVVGVGDMDSGLLPGAGFILDAVADPGPLATEAIEQNLLLAEITLHPVTSIDHSIPANDLARILLCIQRVLKHAYGYWKRATKEIGVMDGHVLNLLAVQPGSVRLVFAGEAKPDLFNSGAAAPAMGILSELISATSDPATAMKAALAYKGHLASSYKDLVDTLVDIESGIAITWADGISVSTSTVSTSLSEAKVSAVALNSVGQQLVERATFTGVLDLIGVSQGKWVLIQPTGKKVAGRVAEGGPRLSDLLPDRMYTFHCIVTNELTGSGKEKELNLLEEALGPLN